LNTSVTTIDWVDDNSDITTITTSSNDDDCRDPSLSTFASRFFICAIPIGCLKNQVIIIVVFIFIIIIIIKKVKVTPPFNGNFKNALDHLKMGTFLLLLLTISLSLSLLLRSL
jgi:hypothetical protein